MKAKRRFNRHCSTAAPLRLSITDIAKPGDTLTPKRPGLPILTVASIELSRGWRRSIATRAMRRSSRTPHQGYHAHSPLIAYAYCRTWGRNGSITVKRSATSLDRDYYISR